MRKYTDEFKRQVVAATEHYSVRELALTLNIHPNAIYGWRYDPNCCCGKVKPMTLEELKDMRYNNAFK